MAVTVVSKDLRKAVWPFNSQPQSYKSILNLVWSAKKAAQYMVQTGLLGQFLEARNRLEVTN
jgi:hypothetical protein